MSMDPPPKPETPRTGKYCPRCHAMAPRDQSVCRQCGHQFRTGADSTSPEASADPAETPAPDPLHRTMQFVLPPLRPRPPAILASPAALPGRLAFDSPRRRAFAVALAVLTLCFGAVLLWRSLHRPALPDTPVGVWETTLHGKASANAHLEFQFQPGGAGRFSWRESGPAALSGQTPLRWKQNPDGTLALALSPAASGDPISQTLVGIFSRPAWPWHVEHSPRRLVLGTLVFTEKP